MHAHGDALDCTRNLYTVGQAPQWACISPAAVTGLSESYCFATTFSIFSEDLEIVSKHFQVSVLFINAMISVATC